MKTKMNHKAKISGQEFGSGHTNFQSNQTVAEVLLSREETKEYLSITFPTLRKWTKDGILKGYQLGGRVYYKLHEILEALIRVE